MEWKGAASRLRSSSSRHNGRPARSPVPAEGKAATRQRLAAALGASRAGSSKRWLRRSAKAATPEASAASCSRRDAVRPSLPSTSPTTAASPGWRNASSITASTWPPPSTRISRRGCSPTAAKPGGNRSRRCITHSTGRSGSCRASSPAISRLGWVPCSVSGPCPSTSCRAPHGRPASNRASIDSRPNRKHFVALVFAPLRPIRPMRTRSASIAPASSISPPPPHDNMRTYSEHSGCRGSAEALRTSAGRSNRNYLKYCYKTICLLRDRMIFSRQAAGIVPLPIHRDFFSSASRPDHQGRSARA